MSALPQDRRLVDAIDAAVDVLATFGVDRGTAIKAVHAALSALGIDTGSVVIHVPKGIPITGRSE